MLGLQELIAVNNRAPIVINDNFNRDCSACRSRSGVVIHSAALRSTSFVDAAEHPESHASLVWVIETLPQAGLNAWIEYIMDGSDVANAETAAIRASLVAAGWRVTAPSACGTQGNRSWGATRPDGALGVSVRGVTLRELWTRCHPVHLTDCQQRQLDAQRRMARHREDMTAPLSAAGYILRPSVIEF